MSENYLNTYGNAFTINSASIIGDTPTVAIERGGVTIDSNGKLNILRPQRYLIKYEFMLLNLKSASENVVFEKIGFTQVDKNDKVKDMLVLKYAEDIAAATKTHGYDLTVHYAELRRWELKA